MNKSVIALILAVSFSATAQQSQPTQQEQRYTFDRPWVSSNSQPMSSEQAQQVQQKGQPADPDRVNAEIATIMNSKFGQNAIDPAMYGYSAAEEVNETPEQRVLKKYKPQQKYKLSVGGNEMIPISSGLPNRITTNFNQVQVIGNFPDNVYLFEEGRYLTIATDSKAPIGMHLREEGMPETTIAVTLFPFSVGQAMIDLDVKLTKEMKREMERRAESREKQAELEESLLAQQEFDRVTNEYVDKFSSIMESVARSDIPAGFILEETPPTRPCEGLASTGIGHVQLQRLSNPRNVVDIVQISNDTSQPVDFDEEHCMVKRDAFGYYTSDESVIVVGSYPRSTLMPGQQAEVYIFREVMRPEQVKRKRTRLISE